MKLHKHSDMIKGWFVGNFDPVVFPHKDIEVAIKYYKAGDHEETHVHRIATEMTAIVDGRVQMMGEIFQKGDIVTVDPGEATDFTAITDCITVVVKSPSVPDDKYYEAG